MLPVSLDNSNIMDFMFFHKKTISKVQNEVYVSIKRKEFAERDFFKVYFFFNYLIQTCPPKDTSSNFGCTNF